VGSRGEMMEDLVIRGFYDNNNTGDEAFKKILGERLKDYNPVFNRGGDLEADTVVIGGGDLSNWMTEPVKCKHLFGIGLGLIHEPEHAVKWHDVLKKEVRRFDWIMVRDNFSYELGKVFTDNISVMGDLAYLLESEDPGIDLTGLTAISPCTPIIDPVYEQVDSVILPFCENHGIWAREVYPNVRYYFDPNPSKILGALKGLKKLVCWNQLHPVIFSALMGIPLDEKIYNMKAFVARCMLERYGLDKLKEFANNGVILLRELLDER
jgi:hypothetical protein